MKLIPKYLSPFGKLELRNDNIKSLNYSVPVVPKENYTPKVNILLKYAEQARNKPLQQISSDNRTSELKKVNNSKVRDIQRNKKEQENRLKIMPVAAPVAIGVALLIPGLNIFTNLGLAGLSAYNLASDNGVKKTLNAFNEGRYGEAARSALGDVLDASMVIGGPYAAYKTTITSPLWRTAFYNNITPGSYNNNISWHPKGKLGEGLNAVKDYFTFNTKMQQHPKWEKIIYDEFNNRGYLGKTPELDLALRREAWQLYQGMPRQHKYILNTGKTDAQGNKIYTLNKNLIPEKAILDFIEHGVSNNKGYIGDVGNYGGRVNLTKSRDGLHFFLQTTDLFDVLPLLNAGRIAESLPTPLRKILFNQHENSPDNPYVYSYTHKSWVPNWLKELEIGKITGGKPFRSTTSYSGKLIKHENYPYKEFTFDDVRKARLELMDIIIESETDKLPYDQMTQSEINLARLRIYKKASTQVGNMTDGEIAHNFRMLMNPSDYLEKYGVYNAYEHWWE